MRLSNHNFTRKTILASILVLFLAVGVLGIIPQLEHKALALTPEQKHELGIINRLLQSDNPSDFKVSKSQIKELIFKVLGVQVAMAAEDREDTAGSLEEFISQGLGSGNRADYDENIDEKEQYEPKDDDNGGPSFMARLVGWIVRPIIRLEGWVISKELGILMGILTYNGFISSPVVQKGWILVRDVANLFFILVLLVIAIGTILRIENYNFKKLLPKVIIMAVLVNFSLVIAGLIIDFAQVIMMTFAASFAAQGAGNIADVLRIKDILDAMGSQESQFDSAGQLWIALIATGLLAVFMLLVIIIVILVILVVILMRVVMLWLLIVLSPLAYIFSAFPQGQRYAQQWWQEFSKYVIIGPVLAFFLWLSFSIAAPGQSGGTSGITPEEAFGKNPPLTASNLQGGAFVSPETDTAIFTGIGGTEAFFSFVIAVALLMGSLVITQQMGVAGGSFAGAMYGRIRQAGLGALAGAVKLPFRGIRNAEKALFGTTGIGLNPMRAVRGLGIRFGAWQARMESQGATKGFGKAKELLTKEPEKGPFKGTRGFFRRLAGVGGMLMSSPTDFAQNFLGLRGLLRLGKTIVSGTSVKEMEDWEKERKQKSDELDRQEKLAHVGDVTEKGKEKLVEEATKTMAETLESGKQIMISEEVKGGPTKAKFMTPADFNTLLTTAKKADLKKYGLEGLIDLVDAKAGGIDTTSAEDVQKFKDSFLRYHAEKLINEAGVYQGSKGSMVTVTTADLQKAGERYYDDEIKRRDEEMTRVMAGGLTDQQVTIRQKELENINREVVSILKKIEGGLATRDEKFRAATLVDKGEQLGGKAVVDTLTGFRHFGQSPTNREKVYKIDANKDIVGKAAKTTDEIKQLAEENELGRIVSTQLLFNRADFVEESRLAKLKPKDRDLIQKGMLNKVEDAKKQLQAEDMTRKKKAVSVPIGYEALAGMRKAEREEMSKLPDKMEWTEIESELFTAMQMKNTARVRALMKKAAVDYNDNEVWRAFGYSQDAKGMREFGNKELVDKLGMNKQEMLKFMDDVAYLNEDRGHYDTSRMVTIEQGMARWASEAEHAASIANENLKSASRSFLQNTNRLGYGGDDPTGKFHLALSGKLTLAGIGDKELQYRLERGEFNPSTLSKIATDISGLSDMVRRGWITQRTMDMITELAKRKTVQAAYSDLLKTAKTASK